PAQSLSIWSGWYRLVLATGRTSRQAFSARPAWLHPSAAAPAMLAAYARAAETESAVGRTAAGAAQRAVGPAAVVEKTAGRHAAAAFVPDVAPAAVREQPAVVVREPAARESAGRELVEVVAAAEAAGWRSDRHCR